MLKYLQLSVQYTHLPSHRQKVAIFRGSSAVEQSPVKRLVAGSNPARGAKKLDTISFFEDERVRPALPAGRSPSPANGGAGLRFATAPPSLCREMKRILMLSGGINFFFFKN